MHLSPGQGTFIATYSPPPIFFRLALHRRVRPVSGSRVRGAPPACRIEANRSRRCASAPLCGRLAMAPVAPGRRRGAFAFWRAHRPAARTSWSRPPRLWRPSSSACSCSPSPILFCLALRDITRMSAQGGGASEEAPLAMRCIGLWAASQMLHAVPNRCQSTGGVERKGFLGPGVPAAAKPWPRPRPAPSLTEGGLLTPRPISALLLGLALHRRCRRVLHLVPVPPPAGVRTLVT
jgi:hypothetical protein